MEIEVVYHNLLSHFEAKIFTNRFIMNCLANKSIWNETYTDTLKRDLLMSYDKFARPMQHYNTTKVTIGLRIKHVEFDVGASTFTVYSWFSMVTLTL